MEKWDYADLTKRAKIAGGPTKFTMDLIKKGKFKGRGEGIALTILTGGVIFIFNSKKKEPDKNLNPNIPATLFSIICIGKTIYDNFSNTLGNDAEIVDEYMRNNLMNLDENLYTENILIEEE